MSNVRMLLARLTGLFHKNRNNHLDAEVAEHAELLAADYVRRGMSETEARYAALREMGNITSLRQTYREQNSIPLLDNLWHDTRYAVRTLRRNRAFTGSATVTLAVGIGSMITVLCVVSAFLWKPLPYPEPGRLVALKEVDPHKGLWPFSQPTLLDVQQRSHSLAAVAGYWVGTMPLTGTGEAEGIRTATVTPSFFKMFGIKPVAGRVFEDAQRYVVISRHFWKREWQMDPLAVGRSIRLGGESYTVAGVADLPNDLLPGVEMLLPLELKATESRTAHEVEAVGRLRKNVTERQAQAELNTIATFIGREHPQSNAGWSMQATALSDYILGPRTGRMLWMILAAVALLWLLACANVAGLQISRNVARRHEMSTRMALGASARRLLAQILTESAVVALAGGLMGVGIAAWAMEAVRRLGADFLPRLAQVHLGGTTIQIALCAVLLSAIVSGMFSGKTAVFQGGRELSRRDRGRDALIVVQVALASVLLSGASLLFRSFLRLEAVDPGFDPDRLLTLRVNLPSDYDDLRRTAFFRDATEQLARISEVASVGATNVAPFSGESTANRFQTEKERTRPVFHSAAWRAVTPGFFTAVRLPLKRGRLFTDSDTNGSLEVVILSESMARRFWPNEDPIGKRLLWGRSGSPKTIVGIVGDLRDLEVDAAPVPTMFRPFAQLPDAPMTMVLRTRGDPERAIGDVRREVRTVDPNAALEFQALSKAMSDSILRPRTGLLIVAAFALVAMITAACGLYGLVGYRVNQRKQEIGVRLALGARASSVRWSVQKRCLMLVFSGLAIGLPLAYVFSKLMVSLLYDTQRTEASAYVAVLLVFLAVAFAASYGPARRASKMDPAAAIRYE